MYSTFLFLLLATSTTPAQTSAEPPLVDGPSPQTPPSVSASPPTPAPAAPAAPAAPVEPPAPPDVVVQWNETALQAIKADRTPPPLAARNLAIVHAAIYDAVNAILRTHQPYRVSAGSADAASIEAAAAIAAHRALVSLYPAQAETFDDALDASLEAIADPDSKEAGVELGQSVAEQILQWRSNDNSNRPIAYTPRNAVGVWRSTPPGYKPGLMPHWRYVTPFAMTSTRPFQPPPPPPLTSKAYLRDLAEVWALGRVVGSTRTPEQTTIALFWDDGEGTVTPPGHWNRIAQVVARQRHTSLAENARLFALLNFALADAAILCWECKFQNAVWRPVTAIHEADRLNNPALTPDPDWMPLLTTPAFPSYTSGHSTFSGAAAAALARFFGTDAVPFRVASDSLPGVVRTYAGFWHAAEEAGQSRIYGGIHYQFDNREGLKSGRALGDWIAATLLPPVEGGSQTQTSEKQLVPIPAYRRPHAAQRSPFRLAIGQGAEEAAERDGQSRR
jgi:hypothetical protein